VTIIKCKCKFHIRHNGLIKIKLNVSLTVIYPSWGGGEVKVLMVVVMDSTIIVCHAVYFGGNVPMFYPEDRGSSFLRNFGNLANFFRLRGKII
jgi:hypothetical protein